MSLSKVTGFSALKMRLDSSIFFFYGVSPSNKTLQSKKYIVFCLLPWAHVEGLTLKRYFYFHLYIWGEYPIGGNVWLDSDQDTCTIVQTKKKKPSPEGTELFCFHVFKCNFVSKKMTLARICLWFISHFLLDSIKKEASC